MTSPNNDDYEEQDLPTGFVDKNGKLHNLKYLENGDILDTVKQDNGTFLTKIYNQYNEIKGKILTDKNKNQTKVIYTQNGIEESIKRNDGSYVLRRYNTQQQLINELTVDKENNFHLKLRDNGKLVNSTSKHLLDLEDLAKDCLKNGKIPPLNANIVDKLIDTQLSEYANNLKLIEKIDASSQLALTILSDERFKDKDGKMNNKVLDILNKTLQVLSTEQIEQLLARGNLSEELTLALENGWSFISLNHSQDNDKPKKKSSPHAFHSDNISKEDEDFLKRCYQFRGADNFKELDRALALIQILRNDGADSLELDNLEAALNKQKNA